MNNHFLLSFVFCISFLPLFSMDENKNNSFNHKDTQSFWVFIKFYNPFLNPLMKALLDKGCIDVNNTQDPLFPHTTPLMLAAFVNETNLATFLLQQKGIKIDFQDNIGETALFKAGSVLNKDIVKLLLDAKADPLIRNNEGQTIINFLEKSLEKYHSDKDYSIKIRDTLNIIINRVNQNK